AVHGIFVITSEIAFALNHPHFLRFYAKMRKRSFAAGWDGAAWLEPSVSLVLYTLLIHLEPKRVTKSYRIVAHEAEGICLGVLRRFPPPCALAEVKPFVHSRIAIYPPL